MLSNLIANAIQHGAETSPIGITSWIASGEIVIQVHNDGPPIAASKIPTTFDFSAQRLTKNAGVTTELGHLGIGLYITGKILVEAHAGKISVTSTAQEGTTFEVRAALCRDRASRGVASCQHVTVCYLTRDAWPKKNIPVMQLVILT